MAIPKRYFHSPKAKTPPVKGLEARKVAARAFEHVLHKRVTLDECFDTAAIALEPIDRALAHRIALTALRTRGWCDAIIASRLPKGLPEGLHRLHTALVTGLVQILFLEVADHAAVDCAVRLVLADSRTSGFSGLTNAVLRGVAREKDAILAGLDPLDNLSPWLRTRWLAAYGEETTRAIARSVLTDPPLDITVKSDPEGWAKRLGGTVMPQDSVRVIAPGMVTALDGFAEGQWWVQDAAASLPARLFGEIKGKEIADLCSAPGGKTAQLASSAAHVTAFDRSAPRMKRLNENMQRLSLSVTTEILDATALPDRFDGSFDGVLLDAPCSATGTLRDHPDLAWLKSEADVASLVTLQQKLLEAAARAVKPGGLIVYATCSLEPEEGEAQIAQFLQRHPEFHTEPVRPSEVGGVDKFVNSDGHLRILPCHWQAAPSEGGIDGFFCARLRRAERA